MKTAELIPQRTLADYERLVKQGIQHIKDAYRSRDLAQDTFEQLGSYIMPLELVYRMPRIDDLVDSVNRRAWRKLMSVTGLADTLDAVALAEFDQSLESVPVVEFTADNARATIAKLAGDQDMMFKRGLVELFKSLSGNYRSHDAFKVQKRSITKLLRTDWYGIGHDAVDLCNDIDRVLCRLTNREFVPYTFQGELERAIRSDRDYENGYITVKLFQNGNAHLIIKDQALIDRINGIIAEWYGDHAIAGGGA